MLINKIRINKYMEADTGLGGGTPSVDNGDNTIVAPPNPTIEPVINKGGETSEKTFTQADVDKIISERLRKEQVRFEKKLENEKIEAEKLAKMKEDERIQYETQKKLAELEERERAIQARELKAEAYNILAEKGLPKELAEILNYNDAESCNSSIDAVEKAFQEAVEKAVNDKLRGNTPKSTSGQPAQQTFGFNFQGIRPHNNNK